VKKATNLSASRGTGSFVDRAIGRHARRGGVAMGAFVALAGSACPVGVLAGASVIMVAGQHANAQCGTQVLTQSTEPDVIEDGSAVWCGDLSSNVDTQIARGFIASHDLTISCVTFGVTRNTGGEWPCHVRIVAGSPTDPYAGRTVLAEKTVLVPAGARREFFTAELPDVFVPEGTAFTVELDTPSRRASAGGDDALLSLGFNGLGQSAPTYLRAPLCGIETEFLELASIGFPDSHVAMSLGTESGFGLPTLGGFAITPIGDVVVSTESDEVIAYGDGGLSIELGDLTMGGAASFRVLSTGDEVDPTVEIAFHGATTTDRLVFRNNPATPNEAVLEVISDNPDLDLFNVLVFHEGNFVGTLEDQTSGSVLFTDPGDGREWKWLKKMFNFFARFSCAGENFETGVTKSWDYGGSIGFSMVRPSGGGAGLRGDEIWIQPASVTISPEPPLSVSILTTGSTGIAFDALERTPSVFIGDASTDPRVVGDDVVSRIGVPFKAINTGGVQSGGSIYATDVTGDGMADLCYAPGLPGEHVRMELGGVESASIGTDVSVVDPFVACMTVCSFEVGPVSIPTGKTIFDPWVDDPMLVAVRPDFTGVGDETYTFQAYDASGTLVHQESGLQGIAGGASHWPSKIGKLGGPTPCFVMCYPDLTLFRMASGHEFDVHEVRVLVEGAPPAGPLSALDISTQGMDEVRFFDPVTVLPDFAEPCYADLDGDGALTLFDFLAFQNLFATGSPTADCDEDGSLTLFDFLCFQNAFAVGCP
jgi:hypothetical protein